MGEECEDDINMFMVYGFGIVFLLVILVLFVVVGLFLMMLLGNGMVLFIFLIFFYIFLLLEIYGLSYDVEFGDSVCGNFGKCYGVYV